MSSEIELLIKAFLEFVLCWMAIYGAIMAFIWSIILEKPWKIILILVACILILVAALLGIVGVQTFQILG